jgi:hypothetical protein
LSKSSLSLRLPQSLLLPYLLSLAPSPFISESPLFKALSPRRSVSLAKKPWATPFTPLLKQVNTLKIALADVSINTGVLAVVSINTVIQGWMGEWMDKICPCDFPAFHSPPPLSSSQTSFPQSPSFSVDESLTT